MNRLFVILPFLFLLLLPAASNAQTEAGSLVWFTDLNKAIDASNSSKKPIFGFFTGSDWCGWCHKLQRDVMAKPAFIDWAKKNVILLELDFPRNKELPAQLSQQNNELAKQFKVSGFPTVWYFMASKEKSGKTSLNPLGSQGYPSSAEKGKEEVRFLSDASAILSQNKK